MLKAVGGLFGKHCVENQQLIMDLLHNKLLAQVLASMGYYCEVRKVSIDIITLFPFGEAETS
jgi:hypothetical protein